MTTEQRISFAEYAQRRNLGTRIKNAFETHVTATLGRLDFRTADEWAQHFARFSTADRRRKAC